MSADLEYGEEDDPILSPTQYNSAAPIAGPSYSHTFTATSRSNAGPSDHAAGPFRMPGADDSGDTPAPLYPRLPAHKESAVVAASGEEIVVDWRYMADLKIRREHPEEAWPEKGVRSLKGACVRVCKAMAIELKDIGEVPYYLAREFVDPMPMEQLATVEDNTPELRKDTDWLWELFLLQDYPTFHASSLLKRGVKRTSGWRRMYKSAMEEARQKQANAEARLAERYKELEEEKERKKVKVLDRAPGKVKRVGGGVYGTRTEPGIRNNGGIFGKARMDTQRLRRDIKRQAASRPSFVFEHHATTSAPASSTAGASFSTSTSASFASAHAPNRPAVAQPVQLHSYRPPATARTPKPYRPSALHAQQRQIDKARAALPAHLRRATAENVAATRAGRNMGIQETAFEPTHDGRVSVRPVVSPVVASSASGATAAATPAGVSAVPVGIAGRGNPGTARQSGPNLVSAPARTSGVTTSPSYQPRRSTSTSIQAIPPTRMTTASRPVPSPLSSPASRPSSTVPTKRPRPEAANSNAAVIDVDAEVRKTTSPVAANHYVPRRPDPIADKDRLTSIMFRKKTRPGTGMPQRSQT